MIPVSTQKAVCEQASGEDGKKFGEKSELTSMKLKNLDESVRKLNKSLVTIAHEQIIICRQLYADHVVNSRLMKRKMCIE